MRAVIGVRDAPFTSIADQRSARGGETAFSPQRRGESPWVATKEGGRWGTMGSPTLNIVKAVQAAAKAGS